MIKMARNIFIYLGRYNSFVIYDICELKVSTGMGLHHSTPTKDHQIDVSVVNGLDNLEIDKISNNLESNTSDSGIVKTKLCPGKVVRRRKSTSKSPSVTNHQRASFPQARGALSENRTDHSFEQKMSSSQDDSLYSSSDKLEGT